MEAPNPNTPIYNFISDVISRKTNEIKEAIYLEKIHFPKILFYDQEHERNKFQSEEHQEFLNDLLNEKELIKVREEREFLEKKISLADDDLLKIKKYSKAKSSFKNNRYINKPTSLNNITIDNNNKYPYYSKNNNFSLNNSKNISPPPQKKISVPVSCSNTLPSLTRIKSSNQSQSLIENQNQNSIDGQNKKKYKILQMGIKPIEKKIYKSNTKVNNEEIEEQLEANAKNFINRLHNKKGEILVKRKQKQQKDYQRLQREIELMERKRYLKEEAERQRRIVEIEKNIEKQILRRQKNNISNIKFPNKKYHYYDPSKNQNNMKLNQISKNFSDELLDFSSQFYYNNYGPEVNCQYMLNPLNNELIGNNNVDNEFINNGQYYDFNEFPNQQEGQEQIIYNNNNFNNEMNVVNTNNNNIIDNKGNEININLPEQYSGIYPDNNNKNMIINNVNDITNNANNSNSINSILDTSDKKSLYYFNEPKYENSIINYSNVKKRKKSKTKNY